MPQPGGFDSIEKAVQDLAQGRMIVVVDDEDRENEGDLTLAAEFATPEAINFMAKFGRGLICLTLTEERADALRLRPMVEDNSSRFGTAFTESIEAREGVTTGISAADRAHTIQVAIRPGTTAENLARPGHVFPLRARKGGVLVRAGQTEASVDLARMAGLIPAGVICEIMNEDGTMARVPDLVGFCQIHGLKMVTVAELIRYRLQNERTVVRVGEGVLPTAHGNFRAIAYEGELDGREAHLALVMGDLHDASQGPVLVRVQTHCTAGALFGSGLCSCRESMDGALAEIGRAGRGALIYLHHTQRGYGVEHSFDGRTDAVSRLVFHGSAAPADRTPDAEQRVLRAVGLGGQILSDLGIHQIRLLTQHPLHVPALQGFGIEIVDQVPMVRSATSR